MHLVHWSFSLKPPRSATMMWYWCLFLQARFPPTFLSKRRVQNRMPAHYKRHGFGRVRKQVDCFPQYTQMASPRHLRRAMHNEYYGTAAAKGILSVTPFGSGDFIGDLYPSRLGDEGMWRASKMGETIPSWMDVSLDKGFYVAAEMFKQGCGWFSRSTKLQRYSQKVLLYSRQVSRNRIHVERQVRRLCPHRSMPPVNFNMRWRRAKGVK